MPGESLTCLVEEDILPISTLRGKILQIPILTDTMLLTQLLPELTADYIPAVSIGEYEANKLICYALPHRRVLSSRRMSDRNVGWTYRYYRTGRLEWLLSL